MKINPKTVWTNRFRVKNIYMGIPLCGGLFFAAIPTENGSRFLFCVFFVYLGLIERGVRRI